MATAPIHTKPQREWPPQWPRCNTDASMPSSLEYVKAKIPHFGQGAVADRTGHREEIPGPVIEIKALPKRPIRNALANLIAPVMGDMT